MTPPLAPIVVTRPEAGGRALTDELAARGIDALWLPAFAIGPAPDVPLARATLTRLADFDLAVFVSPAAVRATAALLDRPWPAATSIGAVGRATDAAVLRSIAGAAAATRIVPDDDDGDSGSEALWDALVRANRLPRRALLLRAEGGRNWLAERLAAAGAEVTLLAVYSRRPLAASKEQLATLARWRDERRAPAALVTSSEAVDVLVAQVGRIDAAALDWLRSGLALATHARIGERLRAAGFARVALVAPQADAIAAALRAQVESR